MAKEERKALHSKVLRLSTAYQTELSEASLKKRRRDTKH
jgi:hypothetical protein